MEAFCELHPMLRVANLYLQCVASVVDVSVTESVVELLTKSGEKYRVRFPDIVQLRRGSPLPFDSRDAFIYIRLQTVPLKKTSGSDSTEVIHLAETKPKPIKKKLWIPEIGLTYRLECAKCGSSLVDAAKFQRVLPLPSGSWRDAASDWFCHRHPHGHQHSGEEEEKLSEIRLGGRVSDCLFGGFFYSLSAELLKQRCPTVHEGSQVACAHCSTEVGRMDTDERIQFWCHGVDWVSQQQRESAASVDQAILLGLSKALEEETSFFGRRLAFRYVTDSSVRTLVVWFVGDSGVNLESSGSTSESREVNLVVSNRRRVLFKCDCTLTAKEDCEISRCDISGAMYDELSLNLQQSNRRLPPLSRTATGFSIGFLRLT